MSLHTTSATEEAGPLRRVEARERATRPTRVAALGDTVEVVDLGRGSHRAYRLVPNAEAAPADGLLSIDSPVGGALLGRRTHEMVDVTTPRGERHLRVLAIHSAARAA